MGGPEPELGGFVGRAAARKRIQAALHDDRTRVRLVMVSGEAGIGKTSLLMESVRDVLKHNADGVAAWGTCWDADRAPGYWPWVQVLRDLLPQTEPDALAAADAVERAALARLVPETSPAGSSPATEPDDTDRARFALFDAVGQFLERVARDRPLVVLLDDLQWADLSSLSLLEFIVSRHPPGTLLILAAYRHDELSAESAKVLAGLGVRATHVRLHGLSSTEVQEFVARSAGDRAAELWGPDLHRRTGGHPFLVRELCHAIAHEPVTSGAPTVPEAAHELIAGRIARVSVETRQLLTVASVAGNDIRPDVLADVLELSPTAVAVRLDEAIRAGIILGVEGGVRVRFAHDLYRETVYAGLATAERMALHQQVGTALERRHDRGGNVFAGEVARQFAAAAAVDGPARAIRWAQAAAAADRGRLAFAEAAAQLARVRRSLDDAGVPVPGALLVDLLVGQADAESRSGDPDGARQLLREAHAVASRIEDPERLATVALALPRLGARFAMPRAEMIALLDEARRAVEGRSAVHEAQVSASLARELHHSVPRDRARARPLSEHALTIARGLDDPATLAGCLLARHDVLWTPGTAAERIELAREIVALAERSGDDERLSEGVLLTANALLEVGSPSFRRELAAFLDLEDGFGQPRHDYLARTRRAALALLDGSLDEAERLVLDAAELGEQIGEPDAGNVRMSQQLELARARGDPAGLAATAEQAVAWWVGVPSHAHAVAAGLCAEGGDLDAARRHLDTVLELDAWREDRSYLWSVFVGGLTAAAARLGEVELSEMLLAELAPLADACGVNGAVVCFMGSHAHWAGVAAASVGRTEEATALLLRAVEVHQRLGARAWEAESRAELARLLGPDEPLGHRDRAQALAAELGLLGVTARLADPARSTAEAGQPPSAILVRDGDLWRVSHGGRSAHLRDSKGLQDLAMLVARPGRDVHVLDLVGGARPGRDAANPVLDQSARADFRRRIIELDRDFAEAEQDHDLGRLARVESERDALIGELRRATGHTGRDRGLGSDASERARKAVTARVREAIRRIQAVVPDLGRHLDRSITTGAFCRYDPREPLRWELS